MSAFEELQRQLADSVAARQGRGPSATAASIMRWWRARTPSGVLTPLLLVAVVGIAVLQRPHAALAPPAVSAISSQYPCRPCQATDGRVHGPLSAEASTVGAETGPVVAPQAARRQARPIVRWTSSRSFPAQRAWAPVG